MSLSRYMRGKKGELYRQAWKIKEAFAWGCPNFLRLGTESCSRGNSASSVILPLYTSAGLDLINLFLVPLYINAVKLKFLIELVGVEGREHLGRTLGSQIIQAGMGLSGFLVQAAAQSQVICETESFSALSFFVLKISKVGNCTTCPDSLFHCLALLIEKLIPIFNWSWCLHNNFIW